MKIRSLFYSILLCVATLSSVNASPSIKRVGDPAKPMFLEAELQSAYRHGFRQIVVRPGVYILPNTGGPVFSLTKWRDATISGSGTTVVMSGVTWGEDCFTLQQCQNVVLKGFTISQSEVPNYQGRVLRVEKDTKGRLNVVWKPDVGYPKLPAATTRFPGAINIVDQHTHELKVGDGDIYNAPTRPASNGSWLIDFGTSRVLLSVGDWLVGRYGSPPIKIHLLSCRNCTVEDVTLLRNGFAPIREEGGGGNVYRNCIWRPGPMPSGADTPDLVTNAADGMHMTGSYPGPDIENCDFRGVFLDDCIAIHGYYSQVKSVAGSTIITTKPAGVNAIVGGRIRISNEHGFYEEANVTAVHNNPDGTTSVTVSSSSPIPVGAKFSSPHADGDGYKIIGCHLGNTRSRGILAKADNGLIENNVITHCGMSAISLGPEYYWGEADYVDSVLVRGNNIQYNGGATYGGAAVWVHGHGAQGNDHILITNNRFFSNYQGDVVVEWARNVAVTSNNIKAPHKWPSTIQQTSPIKLDNCAGIALVGNTLLNTTFWQLPLVHLGNNVSKLTIH